MRILIRKDATARLAQASTKIKIYKFTEHIIRKDGWTSNILGTNIKKDN